jgi:hypothetical protein
MRKCGKLSKELPTSAQPQRAQDQNVILPTHKKKSRQQSPPASRHRYVLTLDHGVPFYDMRANMSNTNYDIMRSSREALPIQKLLTTITTNRLSKVEEDPTHVELLVSFYSPAPDNDTNNFKKSNFKVIMPRSWTPKMYLGALYQFITTISLLTIESINFSGQN